MASRFDTIKEWLMLFSVVLAVAVVIRVGLSFLPALHITIEYGPMETVCRSPVFEI